MMVMMMLLMMMLMVVIMMMVVMMILMLMMLAPVSQHRSQAGCFGKGKHGGKGGDLLVFIISFITSLHCLSFTWLPSRPLLKSTRKLRSLANESFETVLQLSL